MNKNNEIRIEFLPNDLPTNQHENESSIIQLMMQIVNIGLRVDGENKTRDTIDNKEQKNEK